MIERLYDGWISLPFYGINEKNLDSEFQSQNYFPNSIRNCFQNRVVKLPANYKYHDGETMVIFSARIFQISHCSLILLMKSLLCQTKKSPTVESQPFFGYDYGIWLLTVLMLSYSVQLLIR